MRYRSRSRILHESRSAMIYKGPWKYGEAKLSLCGGCGIINQCVLASSTMTATLLRGRKMVHC